MELLPEAADEGVEGAKLDKEEHLFLALDIVVQPGEADAGSLGDASH